MKKIVKSKRENPVENAERERSAEKRIKIGWPREK